MCSIITLSENMISDYVVTAGLNVTKVGFFYNQVNEKYMPLNQSNLNAITNYLTIGLLGNNETGSCIKYYEYPKFHKIKRERNVTQQWIGARVMNKQIIDEWLIYASLPMDSPTIIWKIITNKCFDKGKKNEIELYQYSALVPSVMNKTFMYTFSWKNINTNSQRCYQSTYSLTYNVITCQDYIVDCYPPY